MINFSNLIQILPTESRTGTDRLDQRCNQPTNNLLSYKREQLVQIGQQDRHDNLLALLSGSIANIQRLKTYKKRLKIKNKKPSRIQQHGVNFRNICQIKSYNQDASEHIKNIRLGTLNAISIKSKEELIMENFNEYQLDALLITVTWLQNTDEDDTWLQASKFCKDDHEILNINRHDKRGRHSITILH